MSTSIRSILKPIVAIAFLLPLLSCSSQDVPPPPTEPYCTYTATPQELTITASAGIEWWGVMVWFKGDDPADPDGASLTSGGPRETPPTRVWHYTPDDDEDPLPPIVKVTLMDDDVYPLPAGGTQQQWECGV